MIAAVSASEMANSCQVVGRGTARRRSGLQDHRHRRVDQDEGAEVEERREAAEQPRHQLAAEQDDRDREQQAEHEQADVAVRRAGHRQDVVQAHHHVGEDDRLDRFPQGAGLLDVAVAVALRPISL